MLGVTEETAKKELLRALPLFQNMNEESERLLLSLTPTAFAAGDVIAEDTNEVSLGLMLSGKASIFGKNGDCRVLLNQIADGDLFNAATVFFSERETVSTVIAKTKCQVLFISRACLETLLKGDFAVASAYIELLSGKIYFLNKKILAFTARRADVALARFLLDASPSGDGVAVNMSRLAKALDIGRTTLYRAVDMLTADGAIAYDGKEIKVLSRELLEKRVQS